MLTHIMICYNCNKPVQTVLNKNLIIFSIFNLIQYIFKCKSKYKYIEL